MKLDFEQGQRAISLEEEMCNGDLGDYAHELIFRRDLCVELLGALKGLLGIVCSLKEPVFSNGEIHSAEKAIAKADIASKNLTEPSNFDDGVKTLAAWPSGAEVHNHFCGANGEKCQACQLREES